MQNGRTFYDIFACLCLTFSPNTVHCVQKKRKRKKTYIVCLLNLQCSGLVVLSSQMTVTCLTEIIDGNSNEVGVSWRVVGIIICARGLHTHSFLVTWGYGQRNMIDHSCPEKNQKQNILLNIEKHSTYRGTGKKVHIPVQGRCLPRESLKVFDLLYWADYRSIYPACRQTTKQERYLFFKYPVFTKGLQSIQKRKMRLI